MIKTKDVQISVSKFFTSQWNTRNFQKTTTVEYFYYSIEIKVFQGDNNIIALKEQLLGIILCLFMHLKWQWLLRFFA